MLQNSARERIDISLECLCGQGDYSGLARLWPCPGSRRVGLGRRASAGGRCAGRGCASAALRHLARRHAAGALSPLRSLPCRIARRKTTPPRLSSVVVTPCLRLNRRACVAGGGGRGAAQPADRLRGAQHRPAIPGGRGRPQLQVGDRLPTALIDRLPTSFLDRLRTSFLAGLRC